MASITRGAIRALSAGDQGSVVVQIVTVKTIPPNRVQVTITDGSESAPAMLASQLSKESVHENALFRINKYISSDLNGKRLYVILDGECVGEAAPVTSALPAPAPAAQQSYAPSAPQPSYGSYGAPAAAAPYQPPKSEPQSYGSTKPAPAAYGSYGAAQNNRPVVRDDTAGGAITPINAINPYSSRWTIKARVTAKTDIRRWSNAKGEGTLFSIDLLDSQGGEIRATFFKEACDKFFGVLEQGKVYTFSGGTLKMVQNRQYSNIKNQYELTFGPHSVIMAASEDESIQKQHFSFVKIDSLINAEVGATVDVIAVVRHASEVSEIVSTKQSGRVMQKRELTLVDDSLSEVRITLWGDKATAQHDWHALPIVAFKGVKVGDYGGRSLSSGMSTTMLINPDIPEGKALHDWKSGFQNGLPTGASLTTAAGAGRDSSGVSDPIENRLALSAIKDNGMGSSEKGDYGVVKAYVNFIKHSDADPWYTSCTTPGCQKKVVESGSNWTCEKCNVTMAECNYRYILNMSIMDDTGSTWVTAFNDQAEKLLGVTARELFEMRSTDNQAGYDKVFADCLFKPIIAKLRIKQEMVNDEQRTKSSILALSEVDYVAENQKMLDAIHKYN